jgi:hypothetical protein
MNAKYTNKMEDMILSRYKGNTKNQVKTAKGILKDFKELFATEALKGMTPKSIRDKYQTLKRDSQNFKEDASMKKKATIKDHIFRAMKESDNMTITVKGTEITVMFK